MVIIIFFVSCFVGQLATEDDNKAIKKILKDGNFLYFNFFEEDAMVKSEDSKNNIYTIKLRADEDYAYNIARIVVSKEDTAGFHDISYELKLDQSKGQLEIEGKYITSDEMDGYIGRDIIEKAISSTETLEKVVLNGVSLKPSSVIISEVF